MPSKWVSERDAGMTAKHLLSAGRSAQYVANVVGLPVDLMLRLAGRALDEPAPRSKFVPYPMGGACET
jgi:hypothetical protein